MDGMNKLAVLAVMCLLLPTGCRSDGDEPVVPQLIAARAAREQVNLLAMGDWGNGGSQQRQVAQALSSYVVSSGMHFDGMLLAGDNFYVKLQGTEDPQWQTLFERMYDPDVLDFPFYAALGNHDYEAGKDQIELAYARENPGSRWKMPSRWYRIDFPGDEPLVTVFMLDSDKDLMRPGQWSAQLQWLGDQLRRPGLGKWIVCCAHHPMFSNGSHGDIGPLQRSWGTLFERAGVDFYVCGHDHDLQHLQLRGWDMTFILCGGGGAGVRPMRNDRRGPFSRSVHGFAHISFTPDAVVVRFVDVDRRTVHAVERSRDGTVRVLDSIESDAAPPRTMKSITPPGAAAQPEPVQ